MSNLSLEEAREAYSLDDIATEQAQIQHTFQSVRFAEQVRQNTIACWKKCSVKKLQYPF